MKPGKLYGRQVTFAPGHATTPDGQMLDLAARQSREEESAGAGRVDAWVVRPRPSGYDGRPARRHPSGVAPWARLKVLAK